MVKSKISSDEQGKKFYRTVAMKASVDPTRNPTVTEQTCGEGDDILLPNGPPFLPGSPVLGLLCPPPGNYSSQYQKWVKRNYLFKRYTDLE